MVQYKVMKIKSICSQGINIHDIEVQASYSKGIPDFQISGLADRSIQESKNRVISAIKSSGLKIPVGRIKVNLYPSGITKTGTHLDLPIALSILSIKYKFQTTEVTAIGELKMDGEILESKLTDFIDQSDKPNSVSSSNFSDLKSLVHALRFESIPKVKTKVEEPFKVDSQKEINIPPFDLKVLTYSLLGSHHLHLQGPMGAGKSHLAGLAKLIYPYSAYYREIALLNSTFGQKANRIPFVSVNKINKSILQGQKSNQYFGIINQSAYGILHIDEVNQNKVADLNLLQNLLDQPDDQTIKYNANLNENRSSSPFILISTSNSCPCSKGEDKCICSASTIERYHRKIPNTLRDRIGIHYYIQESSSDLFNNMSFKAAEISETIRLYRDSSIRLRGKANSKLSFQDILKSKFYSDDELKYLKTIKYKLNLSNRDILKIMRLAITIFETHATLKKLGVINEDTNTQKHNLKKIASIKEAIQFRSIRAS